MTLMLGIGMCLAMGVIGSGSIAMMGIGVTLGLMGIAGVSVNYLLYKKLLDAGKQKYGYEIIQLAKEIADDAE